MKMILKTILTGKTGIWAIGIAVAAIVVTIGYGIMRIQALDATLDAREQRIEYVEAQYQGLSEKYTAIEQDFTDFVLQVQNDLAEQKRLNANVRQVNNQYRQRVLDLEQTFLYDESGNLRNWNDIIDDRSEELERIINERTRGIGNEFEKITTD